jgi:hypothetical protein
VRIRAEPQARPGVYLIAFDISADGRRFGERFDCIVSIEDLPATGAGNP